MSGSLRRSRGGAGLTPRKRASGLEQGLVQETTWQTPPLLNSRAFAFTGVHLAFNLTTVTPGCSVEPPAQL